MAYEYGQKIAGIDLGTTNSAIAFMEMDMPSVIGNSESEKITPSVVYFKKDGTVVVGRTAKQNIIANAHLTVRSIKRHIGTDYRAKIGGDEYPPEYISAHILRKLVNDAYDRVGIKFRDVVIAVPAYFTDSQRQATKDAAEIAGLNVRRIINEPTAAALAYGFNEEKEKRILVYDFGGGTLDVSVMTIGNGFFDVDATSGDNHLGGDDIDERLMDYIIKKIEFKYHKNIRSDLTVMQALRESVEAAKIKLSTSEKATISLPYIGVKNTGYLLELDRQKFNEMTKDIIERTKKPIENVLKDAALCPSDIEEIILVGGSTRIPAVYELVRNFFGKEPNMKVNPDEAVALGAAIAGMRDVREKVGDTVKKKIEVSDVISHSLGVLTADGTISHILKRNTKVPIAMTKEYTNAFPYIEDIEVPVFQGESMFPDDKGLLGTFWVSIEPRPLFQNKIDVTFEVGDEFGIVHVTAKDKHSGNKRTVRMEAAGRLSKDEKSRWTGKMHNTACIKIMVENAATRNMHPIHLNPDITISDVRQMLADKGMLGNDMALFYKEKELDGAIKVSEAGLKDNDTIEVNYKDRDKDKAGAEKENVAVTGIKDGDKNGGGCSIR